MFRNISQAFAIYGFASFPSFRKLSQMDFRKDLQVRKSWVFAKILNLNGHFADGGVKLLSDLQEVVRVTGPKSRFSRWLRGPEPKCRPRPAAPSLRLVGHGCNSPFLGPLWLQVAPLLLTNDIRIECSAQADTTICLCDLQIFRANPWQQRKELRT